MLIPLFKLKSKYNINLSGILHIGAHECEELQSYQYCGVSPENIIWVEGNQDKVNKMKNKGIKNIYHGLISDKIEMVDFIITNNGESSSILELGEHKKEHPDIHEVNRIRMNTTTIENLLLDNDIFIPFNFVVLDVQGVELKALKGMSNLLPYIKYIYTEVNIKYIYENCALITEIDEYLEGFGFKRMETAMTKHGWGDAFYMK
jgi:FkbM family methyltransferase